MSIARLEPAIRHYAWGSTHVLPELLGRPNPGGEPWAELWFGDHARGGASVAVGAADPERLGTWLEREGRPPLGFLLKLLAADRALSLQLHPAADEAARGHARESARGIEAAAPERSFPDPHAKPELLCALSRFDALCGFREPDDLRAAARSLGVEQLEDRLREVDFDAREALVRAIEDQAPFDRALRAEIVARCRTRVALDPIAAEVAHLAESHPDDPAVLAPLLLRQLRLEPGEALFVEPGQPHAYLRGLAAELMAPSDNVVRLGLTRKPLYPGPIRALLGPRLGDPRVATRPTGHPDECLYEAPSHAFELRRVELEAPRRAALELDRGPEILLCTEGAPDLCWTEAPVRPLRPGAAVLVWGEAVEIRGPGCVLRARAGRDA